MTNSIPLNGSIRASVMRNPRRDAELEGSIQGIRDQFRVEGAYLDVAGIANDVPMLRFAFEFHAPLVWEGQVGSL